MRVWKPGDRARFRLAPGNPHGFTGSARCLARVGKCGVVTSKPYDDGDGVERVNFRADDGDGFNPCVESLAPIMTLGEEE